MSEGARIRILPEDVANKIAAGEVVERPASVVKELMENAIDAGASRIDVVVTAGGRRLISVADDGCGMGRDDALLAPERQATSKLRTAEDLSGIATMGFRGEALPSIASVSRFTLRTRRREDEAGTEVEIHGGTMVAVRDCGAAPGTTIEVRDLFYNVPARRAFLRSYNTEQAHVRAMFLVHAIAWPGLAMSLTCDGDPVHRLRPAASLRERLDDLYGAGYMDGHYIASFCGFAPVEDPQITVLVIVDDPSGIYYGGQVAAPVASRIFKSLLRYLKVEPSSDPFAASERTTKPTINENSTKMESVQVIVPEVIGLDAVDARRQLEAVGLVMESEGQGRAVSQSISPNVVVPRGTVVAVRFAPEAPSASTGNGG